MSEPKLTYGIDTESGKLKSIREVSNGLLCKCKCPNCGEALIAVCNEDKKKYKREAHFRHYSNMDCLESRMSALHLLAQNLILQYKKILLPEYNGHYYYQTSELLFFDEVRLEECKKIDDNHSRRPDIIGVKDGEEYWIEIYVTHPIDKKKYHDIKQLGVNCIEIDLRVLLRTWFDEPIVYGFLFEKTQYSHWINCPKLDRVDAEEKINQEYQHLASIKYRQQIICNKLISSFRERHFLTIEIQRSKICKNFGCCPLAGPKLDCEEKLCYHSNLAWTFDTITKQNEYDNVLISLVLTNSQNPQKVLLFQIIMADDNRKYSYNTKYPIIRIKISNHTSVEFFDANNILSNRSRYIYSLEFYNFPPISDTVLVRRNMCGDGKEVVFRKVALFKDKHIVWYQGNCHQIQNPIVNSMAEYIVTKELGYPLDVIKSIFSFSLGLPHNHCLFCKCNYSDNNYKIECMALYDITKNQADACHFYFENKMSFMKTYCKIITNSNLIQIK